MRTVIGKLVLLLGVMSLTLSNATHALTISTANDLEKLCNAVEHFPECVSYLETVYKTAKAIDRMNEPQLKEVIGSCGPEKGIDTVPLSIALRLAWQEYAAQHQGRLQQDAAEEALLAFEARWPCKR